MKVGVYQIFYNEHTRNNLNPVSIPYDNSWHEGKPLQPAIENHVIVDIIKNGRHLDYDYFSVLSWQFENKNQVKIDHVKSMIEKGDWTEDVITCFKRHEKSMWKMAAGWHKGIIEIAQYVFKKLGYDLDLLSFPMTTVYQNAHFTKSKIYERYVSEMLAPTLEMMFTDAWLIEKLNIDTKYRRTSDQVKDGTIARLTGYPFYTMHPFVCERMFATWLGLNKEITIRHIK